MRDLEASPQFQASTSSSQERLARPDRAARAWRLGRSKTSGVRDRFAGRQGVDRQPRLLRPQMSRNTRSSLVQRSASTSLSRADRISCSLRGPSSKVTRSVSTGAEPATDVVAADDQILAVIARDHEPGHGHGGCRCSNGRRRPNRASSQGHVRRRSSIRV